jgi:SagB-type dehydrogenase family enzyme
VEEVPPAIYHYSALHHSIHVIARDGLPAPGAMLGNQRWADAAGIVIFLVANFGRTMWKYRHPNAYRVILIEAGHIAQNMALAATEVNLVTCPTCAITDWLVEKALGLNPLQESAVYALAIGTQVPK